MNIETFCQAVPACISIKIVTRLPKACSHITLYGLLVGCLAFPVANAQITSQTIDQPVQSELSPSAEARRKLVFEIKEQAKTIWALNLAKAPSDRYPKPNPAFGEDSGSKRFPFGWSIQNQDGMFLQLSDVRETVVNDFNKAVHGRGITFDYKGASAYSDSKPYGTFSKASHFALIIPVKWLEQDGVTLFTPPPGTIELTGEMVLKNPKLTVGIPLTVDELESLGIFSIDDIAATAIHFNLKTAQGVRETGDSLFEGHLNRDQAMPSAEKTKLLNLFKKCKRLSDPFERKDCVQQMIKASSDYGQKIVSGKMFNVFARAPTFWDDANKRISIPKISYKFGSDSYRGDCQKDSICMNVGSYGAASNVVCYRLSQQLPRDLNIPMPEEQARALGKQAGGLDKIWIAAAVLEVKEPAKLLSSPRMCTENSNKVVAEGSAVLRQLTLWTQEVSVYAVLFTDNKSNPSGQAAGYKGDLAKPLTTVNALPSSEAQASKRKPVLETK